MIRALPALVLAAGCFSVPPYEPETGIGYTESAAGGGTVTGRGPGPAFALRFADGPGFHFPDALTIDGADVMGHEASPGCFRQDELGMLIAPTARISAHGGAAAARNLLTPALRGPAVVQVKLDWGTGFPCSPTRTPGGTSTFTVFPDGKIVRRDTLDDPVATPISPVPCACEEPTQSEDQLFHISAYWTLARASFTTLTLPNDQARPLPPSGDDSIGNQPTSCVQGAAFEVAFAWSELTNTRIRGGGAVIGFSHELGAVGASELQRLSLEDRSAIFLDRGTCTVAMARADQYLAAPKIMIDGAPTPPAERDGIYGGDAGGDAGPGIELGSDRVELAGPTPAGFAVWVRFPRAVDGLRTTHSGAAPMGEWYLPQRVDDRSWILWFRDALPSGSTIAVEAR